MHSDLDTDMDTDTETTALCPSSSHRASPPETPTPGLDWGRPPPAPGAPRRRGSMPVPYKHQLRRAQAVDELDWPPQASSSGSSDSLGSGEAAPTQKDGIFKVMLVGESGVGKSTLAGTFGGLQGDSAHELENPEDTYKRRIMVDKEEVTLVVYDIWEQSPTDEASPKFQRPYFGSGLEGPTTTCLSSLLETRVTWPAPGRSHWRGRHLAGTLSCKHIETSAALHHNTRELFEGAVRQIRLRRGRDGAGGPRPEWGSPEGPAPPARRESLTKKAKRFLANLVPRNAKFFKQRSRSCHDLSVL
ncbi:REM2 [Cervus elaphus hippelaphus]|uniref:REM2 n=1 Tax=Cervus elaphus hippelaphus TaxID=46360 RepID=A0A212CU27_CEREH|nr:REM2 [Cervus elaphus hippelaphus]